jgi:replicative DNA helicase
MTILPNDITIEKAVLGHILNYPDAIFEVLDIMTDEVFYDVDNRLIYRTVMECVDNSMVPDTMNVFLANRTINYDYLTSLTGGHIMDYREKTEALVSLSLKRKMYTIGERLQRDSLNPLLDPFDVNDQFTSELIDVLPNIGDNHDDMRYFIPQFVKEIEEIQITGSKGITTGIEGIDRTFGGFIRNQFVLIGARPAVGKSAFILNMIEHILYLKKNVGVISLEMDKREIYERMVSTSSRVKHDRFTKGGLDGEDSAAWNRYNNRFTSDEYGRMYVNDKAPLKFAQVRANAIKWKKQNEIDILFIDHIGLITGEGTAYESISKISRNCKLLAKEIGIPVVALSQLSRGVEHRGASRPKLSDLKDSGSLEADANVVWFLYGDDEETNPNLPLKTVFCECAKNRGGALFNVELNFAKEILKFKDKNSYNNPNVSYDIAPPKEIPLSKRSDNFIDIPF